MTDTSSLGSAQTKPPLYRDATVLKWVAQLVTLATVVLTLWFLATEAGTNLSSKGLDISFDFLNDNPNIQLSEGIDTSPATGGRALWVGMVTTLRIAGIGIVAATVLGVFVGLARLSTNWMINKIGSVYVETMRNIPLLVQIILYLAIINGFPDLKSYDNPATDVGPINGWLHVTNKGIQFPRVHIGDGFYQWAVFMLIGLAVARWVYNKAVDRRDAVGDETHPVLKGVGVLVVFGAIGWFVHPVFAFIGPILQIISDGIASIPAPVVQIVLAVLLAVAAANWIRNFFRDRRTPGGSAQLTDDDWFRVVFAGVGALIGIVFVFKIWPGGSSWLVNSTSDLFAVLADKFDSARTGAPFGAERPDINASGNFANPGKKGFLLSPAFAAVLFGVIFYTAAFIGENVRGGIMAISKGQAEAAAALGLSKGQSLRKIILPQAVRVILPPVGNQYLNLTKNTSLAVAVGLSDVVQVGGTLNSQFGVMLSVLPIWMGFYLACSLTLSAIVNFFNVRMAIVER